MKAMAIMTLLALGVGGASARDAGARPAVFVEVSKPGTRSAFQEIRALKGFAGTAIIAGIAPPRDKVADVRRQARADRRQ